MDNIKLPYNPEINLLVSANRSPLEQPWSLTVEEFTRRVGVDGIKVYQSAQGEIGKVEFAIDERVKGLYGV